MSNDTGTAPLFGPVPPWLSSGADMINTQKLEQASHGPGEHDSNLKLFPRAAAAPTIHSHSIAMSQLAPGAERTAFRTLPLGLPSGLVRS